ncbi:MAG: sodium:calcium antiporter [Thermomicrobiales bacterium]
MTLLIALLLVPVALVLLEWGAETFTDGVAAIGEETGIPETLLGLLTAGIEWEELAVVAIAAASGRVGIAVGDVIGSNIANITGSFSLGLLAAPIAPGRTDRRFALTLLAVTALVCAPLATGEVGRPVGGALVIGFVGYLVVLIALVVRGRTTITRADDDDDDDDATVSLSLPRLVIRTLLGLAAILIGAAALVQGAVRIAAFFGVPDVLIGLTVVAVGTTLPDKFISIVGARRGQSGVVIANTVGSNFCNLLAALGVAALIRPLPVDRATRFFDLPVLLGTTALLASLLTRRTVGRWVGGGLLVLYLGYLVLAALIH